MEELQLKKILHNFSRVSESGVHQYVILVNKEMLDSNERTLWLRGCSQVVALSPPKNNHHG